jgi:GNAT superfamily N-acetyltransferase
LASAITFRPFMTSDFEPLARLSQSLWYRMGTPEVCAAAAAADLAGYLAEASYRIVAEKDGTLVGATLCGMSGNEPSDAATWRKRQKKLRVATGTNPGDGGVTQAEERLTAEYLESGRPETDAVIKLLALDPATQGQGAGGRMLEMDRTYLRSLGARGYFLLTDDDCDYSFYDHKGLARAATHALATRGGANGRFNVYIYSERF